MKTTVIIANHNYGKWITDSIMSVVNNKQEFSDDSQIIVVDDGSTDDSLKVISQLAGIDLMEVMRMGYCQGQVEGIPLKLAFHEKSRGPSAARNLAIKLEWSSTDIYSILDADDIFLPGKISLSLSKFVNDPNIGAVYTDYNTVDIKSGLIRREYKEPFNMQRLLQECIIHSACMIRKSVLEKVGLYDENLRVAEDFDLWIRVSQHCCFAHIPLVLMNVRTGSYNSTNTVDKRIWEQSWKYISQKYSKKT